MPGKEYFDNEIKTRHNELKDVFSCYYGDPSYDELTKFLSMNNIYNLSLKKKFNYIKVFDCIKENTDVSSRNPNLLTINQRLDYTLTFIKLIDKYGEKLLDYVLYTEFYTLQNNFCKIAPISKLIVILESFNKIKVSEYDKYKFLFFNRKYINYLTNIDATDLRKNIKDISSRIDIAIKLYDYNYDAYKLDNKKNLIDSTVLNIVKRCDYKDGMK